MASGVISGITHKTTTPSGGSIFEAFTLDQHPTIPNQYLSPHIEYGIVVWDYTTLTGSQYSDPYIYYMLNCVSSSICLGAADTQLNKFNPTLLPTFSTSAALNRPITMSLHYSLFSMKNTDYAFLAEEYQITIIKLSTMSALSPTIPTVVIDSLVAIQTDSTGCILMVADGISAKARKFTTSTEILSSDWVGSNLPAHVSPS